MTRPIHIALLGADDKARDILAGEISSAWPYEALDSSPTATLDRNIIASVYDWRLGFKRHFWDAGKKPIESSLDSGTGLDYVAAAAYRMDTLAGMFPDISLTHQDEYVMLRTILPTLSILSMETWSKYDYVFYLTLDDDVSDPDMIGVDKSLVEIIESYDQSPTPLNVLTLSGGTMSDKAATVIKVIEKLEPARCQRLDEIEKAEAALAATGDAGDTDRDDQGSTESPL